MTEDSSPETEARALCALKLRLEQGYSLAQVAKHFGISKERGRQLCAKAQQLAQQTDNIWYDLPTSIRGALHRDGCEHTIDAVCERYTLEILERVPGMGRSRTIRLQEWLMHNGRPPIQSKGSAE
jgi:hypothetical protein